MEYQIKAYQKKDQKAALALFDSNLNPYFLDIERKDFIKFLNEPQEVYQVVWENQKAIAAGGFRSEKPNEARICWFMVDRETHGKGIGKFLLESQLAEIKSRSNFEKVSLMTSQLTDGFYKSLGFKTTREEKDYWEKGLHLVYMEMGL